jgi:hypothetical protein
VPGKASTSASATTDKVLDPESAEWLRTLSVTGREQQAALARLHLLLLRIARREIRRRTGSLPISGPDLDDLAHQAAADAMLAITGKPSAERAGSPRGHTGLSSWRCQRRSAITSGAGPVFPSMPRTGIGYPTGSDSNPVERRSGATSSLRCAARWRRN